MKKTVLSLAVLSGFGATAAHAQSSVTLYGLIDEGFVYSNNVKTSTGSGHRYALASGNINGSRWGLRGSEDLGGGLKAIFQLENGFNVSNGTLGQQGREFGRQAFVGLSSVQYGTATLGRQYDSVVDFLGPMSLTGTGYGGYLATHPYDNDNLDDSFRVSNSVKYMSPNFNGLKFGGLYGFSNSSTGFSQNRAYSGGVSYTYGGFNLAAGYMELNNSLSGTTPSSTTGAVSDAVISAARTRILGGGFNYAFGPAVVGFVFTQSKYDDAGLGATSGSVSYGLPAGAYLRFNNYEANVRYSVTPAWSLAAQFTYTQARESGFAAGGESTPKFYTASFMTSYSLSKRTDIYAQAVYMRINGHNFLGGADILDSGGASTTNKQVVGAIGIRHRF
ncbi:MAG: porin [Janthinobacterium lividum]